MKRPIIPGHARGYTIPLIVIMAVILFFFVENKVSVVYTLLAFATVFLGDQATHLHQADHSGPPPTWLECQLKNHTIFFQVASIIIAIALMRAALQ